MFGPAMTHGPCDLNQQRKRHEAARERLSRAVLRRRRGLEATVDPKGAGREDEDVFHGFRF